MSKYGLVGDIGGTNARFGLVSESDWKHDAGDIQSIKIYPCKAFSSIAMVINRYLSEVEKYQRPSRGVIAIPCPIEKDEVHFANIDWKFSIKSVQEETAVNELEFINDFHAQAYSAFYSSKNDKVIIGGGIAIKDKPVAVIGPGSGLGVSGILSVNNKPVVIQSEGGHTGFTPSDDIEIEIAKILIEKFGRLSNERLLSGQGIENLYMAIHQILGKKSTPLSAPDISTRALAGECEICSETLGRFCSIFGTFAGDLALSMGALGGVYITGGIVPRFVEYVRSSFFRKRFEDKGRFQEYMKNIPTFIVTSENPGLNGAGKVFFEKNK